MKLIQRTIVVGAVFTLFSFGLIPASMAQYQRPYRYNDTYVKQIIQRLETRTDRFSSLLPNALDQSQVNGTKREDQVNNLVTNFEHATDVLKDHFNNQQSTAMDAEAVLREGARIDTFMRNHRLGNRTEGAWNLVRADLDRLSNTYSVASNWRYMQWPTPTSGPVYSGYDAMLTGTFRLNSSMSDNPKTVADNATRYSSYADRQAIYFNLINRLTPPEMIAVERHGNAVTLASTRTPEVRFDVDGVERLETYPDGRTTHVRANFSEGELKVVSNADRVNDFTATFTPMDNGRRMLVTREIYAERLAQPVTVRSYYDRTSDVAQWNVYNGAPIYSGSTSLTFLVPDNTEMVARLNNDLSTRSAHDGQTFAMRVLSPATYRDAVIEGHITGVDRSGRFAGRSRMTLNFDRIRLRNGQNYNFAGVVQSVQTLNGETARVDNEGAVREDDRTNTTLERTGIGTAIGALIGAIADGGKGAAIGAVVGAGAGAGSVYVEGRDDLDLGRGTEFTVRASSPLRY